jgi:fucose permease
LTSRFAARREGYGISLKTTAATLSQRSVIQFCLVIFFYVLAETALVGFLNVYLFEFYAAPEGIAIQSISLFWGVMLVGRVLCGLLPGRIADRKLVSSTMMVGAVMVAASFLAGDWPSALAFFLGAGFLMAGAWPTVIALTAAQHREFASTVVGVTVAIGSLGCVIAPPLMGLLFQVADPALVMAVPAVPLLLGGLLALQVPRKAGQDMRSSPDRTGLP